MEIIGVGQEASKAGNSHLSPFQPSPAISAGRPESRTSSGIPHHERDRPETACRVQGLVDRMVPWRSDPARAWPARPDHRNEDLALPSKSGSAARAPMASEADMLTAMSG